MIKIPQNKVRRVQRDRLEVLNHLEDLICGSFGISFEVNVNNVMKSCGNSDRMVAVTQIAVQCLQGKGVVLP